MNMDRQAVEFWEASRSEILDSMMGDNCDAVALEIARVEIETALLKAMFDYRIKIVDGHTLQISLPPDQERTVSLWINRLKSVE